MMDWIRKNLVLVAGVVLPVLLVAAFLLLQGFNEAVTDPPDHDFLVAGYWYDNSPTRGYHLRFEVSGGRLQGLAVPVKKSDPRHEQNVVLYRYRASERAFKELAFDLPRKLDGISRAQRFDIDELAGLKLDKRASAPDGWVFEYYGYRSSGGLLGDLFGMGRRHSNPWVLRRDGSIFQLPAFEPNRYHGGNQLEFIAWVVEEAVQP